MILLILFLSLVLLYPFSIGHAFSIASPDPLFMFSHLSWAHLAQNLFAFMIVLLISWKEKLDEFLLTISFFVTSIISLIFVYLFDTEIMGASVGIYGMFGFILPDLEPKIPLYLSYPCFLVLILLETCPACLPWEKLFHLFGLTLGILMRFMLDLREYKLKEQAAEMGYGLDYYSRKGFGYIAEMEK
ncbi:MAG: rhomboid family intramembrane serine protease [Candidatus Altiarchaeota archaeon]|nr:rhomboid family intramembrane serine protease [Candidatus Altiarchaeota archaeon]